MGMWPPVNRRRPNGTATNLHWKLGLRLFGTKTKFGFFCIIQRRNYTSHFVSDGKRLSIMMAATIDVYENIRDRRFTRIVASTLHIPHVGGSS